MDEGALFEKLFVVTSNEHRLRAQKVLPQLPKKKLLTPNPKAAVGERAPDLYRFEHTMHVTPLPKKWVRSIGCWGQVLSLPEILGTCDVDLPAAKSLKYRYGLRTCSPLPNRAPERRSQVDVALDCYVDWLLSPKLNLRAESQRWAQKAGVLPIEFCIYNTFIEDILARQGVGVPAESSPEAIWEELFPVVEPEWPKYQALLLDAVTKYDGV